MGRRMGQAQPDRDPLMPAHTPEKERKPHMTITETAARQVFDRFTTLSDDDLRALRSDRGLIVGDCAVWLAENNRIVAWTNLADDPADTVDEWFAIDAAFGWEVEV